jgi:hypothetical protein
MTSTPSGARPRLPIEDLCAGVSILAANVTGRAYATLVRPDARCGAPKK